MAYTINVPQANQKISSTQQPIQDNFIAINTWADVDHFTLDAPNQGKHKFIHSPTLNIAGGNTATGPNEYGIYCNGTGASAHLYIKNPNTAAGVDGVAITQKAWTGQEGYTRLPSGLTIAFGRIQILGAGGLQTITFPVGAFTVAPYSINLSLGTDKVTDPSVRVYLQEGTVTAVDFQVRSYNSALADNNFIYYTAFGV